MFSLFCSLFSHKINRNRVWFDSLHHRTICELCSKAMIRDISGWREFDSEDAADLRRTAHPLAQT